MSNRLPTVGGDNGNWGSLLNNFLQVSHNSDGSLKNFYINAKNDYGAAGDGTTDDTTAIQNALNAAPLGGIVFLPPGTYVTSSPLTIPPQVTFLGTHSSHLDSTTCAIQPSSSFSGAAVILIEDQTTGGYSVVSNQQRIKDITLEGSNLSGSTIDGVQAQGLVHGVILQDIQIRDMPNHGIAFVTNSSGTAYSWRGTRIVVKNCNGYGYSIGGTDCTWFDMEAIGCGKSGFYVGGGANSHYVSCRAEWNSFDGFTISGAIGQGTGSGACTFVDCSTDRNTQNGIHVNATGTVPFIFTGLMLRRDGRNSGSGGGGYAGFKVDGGATVPVIVNGATCFPGVDDDGTQTNSPQYGFAINSSSSNVVLVAGFFQGNSGGVHDDGTNSNWYRSPNVFEATGATNAQTFASTYPWTVTGLGTITQASDAIALQLTNSVTNTNQALLNFTSNGATGLAIKSKASGDAASRFQQDVSGNIQWGDGTNAKDTNLYRSAANILTTDYSMSIAQNLTVTQRALGIPRPSEHSLVAWTFDPAHVSSGKAGVAGTVYFAALYINKSVTLTKLLWGINSVGSGATASENFVGLYNSSGTQIASVGVDSRVTTSGLFTETISVAVTPGVYWVAFLFNASGMPQVYRGQDLNATLMNANLTASSMRFCTNTGATGQTSLSSITPSNNVAAQFCYWAAVA